MLYEPWFPPKTLKLPRLPLPRLNLPMFAKPALLSPTLEKPTLNWPMFPRPRLNIDIPVAWSWKNPARLLPMLNMPETLAGAPMPVLNTPETVSPRFASPDCSEP
ncbi:Uncharacterised protein [Mycobacterium tuberculosis]|nr:Uncharacterised protein [Mycobacterium tuberculosis]